MRTSPGGASGTTSGIGSGMSPGPRRVLIYSHDTFGLGHLRRARAIANALVGEDGRDATVVILSGSPVIGSFAFGAGVDFVRLPGVTKLPDGDYRSLNLGIPLGEAVALREALIRQTAERFAPDLFLVDKEPTGFHGEVVPTLAVLRERGCRLVLGLRDVLDDPALLAPEWERKGALGALSRYDAAWIYGLPEVCRPLDGLVLPAGVEDKLTYTGYLRRAAPASAGLGGPPGLTDRPFLLVTPGGGGDGEALVERVVRAYEHAREAGGPDLLPALIVFGPFFGRVRRRALMERIARHPRLDALGFETRLESLMARAAGVVAMGGYNTFCEILSFDRPALLVPRTRPRREQLIRAQAASRLGLVEMIAPDEGEEADAPARMAAALARLPDRPGPLARPIPGLLDGLPRVRALVRDLTAAAPRPDAKLAAE